MVTGQHSLGSLLAPVGTFAANYVVYYIEQVLIGGLDIESMYSSASAALCQGFINR